MIDLYSGKILALAANLPDKCRLSPPCLTGKARSPVCGSVVTVDLRLVGDVVTAFGQDVKACALGQAAASVICGAIIGTTGQDIRRGRGELASMLSGGPAPTAPWEGLSALRPAAQFQNRHDSILLCFDAAIAALDGTREP